MASIDCCWVRGGVGGQLPRYWYWSEPLLSQKSRPSLHSNFIWKTRYTCLICHVEVIWKACEKLYLKKLGIMQVPWILEWNLWLNTNYSRFQIQLISELNQHFCHWWLNIFVSITKWNSCGWWKFWFIKLSPQSKIQICKVLMMSICSKFIPSLSNNQLMTTYLL